MRLRSDAPVLSVMYFAFLYGFVLLLSACGGGGGSDGNSLPVNPVTVSGTVTYDFVPFNHNFIGLDYAATEARPVRGAVVELVNRNGAVVATTSTDESGYYRAQVEANSSIRVQVKAQLRRTQSPTWDMKVTDNTNNHRLYALVGSEANTGTTDSQRNLHAASGWATSSYATLRPAAPFAILDSVYIGLQRFIEAGYATNFPPLELRWSTKNNTAVNTRDDFSTGEIGSSFYWDGAIYILGAANQDTDEYDTHVILHEWGHYIEAAVARADSIGGPHEYGDHLDFRVAFSEGFSNAFAAMMLDDPIYRDSLDTNQASGFMYDITEKNHPTQGWYSEASIESVIYNYYTSSNNKTARDFSPILTTLASSQFYNADSMLSIFLFAEQLTSLYPTHRNLFESLLEEQDINSMTQYAQGESNSGGVSINLPVYKTVQPNSTPTNVCTTSRFIGYNALGFSQFLRLSIQQQGQYGVRIDRVGGDFVTRSDPDFIIYRRGDVVAEGYSQTDNLELQTVTLPAGNYIMEVYDWEHASRNTAVTTCFDVRVAPL